VFVLQPFVRFDPALLPPRQWLYSRHYQRRTVSATIAPGGFGAPRLESVPPAIDSTCEEIYEPLADVVARQRRRCDAMQALSLEERAALIPGVAKRDGNGGNVQDD
jgi:hypothetical protein